MDTEDRVARPSSKCNHYWEWVWPPELDFLKPGDPHPDVRVPIRCVHCGVERT